LLQDKSAIIQVLGCILQKPTLLGKGKDYNLTKEDFPESFHKIIFAAINNLYENNPAGNIGVVEVDGFLANYEIQYKIFNDNNGIEYLYQIQELSQLENFDYYYNRLKKYSFLRACKGKNVDISDLYIENLINPKEEEVMQEQFDGYTLNDLMSIIERKVIELKEEFKTNKNSSGIQGAEGIKDTIKALRINPDFGAPLCSKLLNAITRGARKKKFYLRSSITGGGKTRMALADLLNICVDEIYDLEKEEWVSNGEAGRGLFITTELEFEEIQTPSLAFISGVSEDKILDGKLTKEENKRIEKAIEIFERTNFWIEYLPDFDLEDIEQTIEKHVFTNDVEYIVFDYIHSSVKLLSSISTKSRISNMREDQILLLMSSRLKEICNRHGVWMLSGTQLNGDWEEKAGSNAVRGSKAIIDKADFFAIVLPVTAKDLDALEPILRKEFMKAPNSVTSISKLRRGKFNNTKLWQYVDLGNLRATDCFVTWNNYTLVDIKPIDIKTKKLDL
jgi:replicative DNA helicase